MPETINCDIAMPCGWQPGSRAIIGRFYAGQSMLADKIRIVSSRPPVPIAAAVRALWKSHA